LSFLFYIFFVKKENMDDDNNYNYNDNYFWTPTNSAPSADVVTVPIQVEEFPVCTPFASLIEAVDTAAPLKVVTVLSEASPDNEFELLSWDTCDYNDEGVPIGYMGKLWMNFPVLKLQVICRKLVVYGIKNAKKEHIVESIVKTQQNSKAYAMVRNSIEKIDNNQQGSTRKEQQCAYRVMNILFSDDFAEQFACIGNIATRKVLDIGKAANEKLFWEKIEDAYLVSKSDYNILQFRDDDNFMNETIYPGKIVPHGWQKLRTMWKAINADYKTVTTKFTQSGTHDSEFYNYCQGKKEPYYLRLLLSERPELNEMVDADLPEACTSSISSSTASKEDISVNTPVVSQKLAADFLAEVIKETFSKDKGNELAEFKM
jgi:hypothetical protein